MDAGEGRRGLDVVARRFFGSGPSKFAAKKAEDTMDSLSGKVFSITSNVWGFVDFTSLIELKANQSAYFFGGMISEPMGVWTVVPGTESEGESEDDMYLQFTQPMNTLYSEAFDIQGGTAFWRCRVNIPQSGKGIFLQNGQVCSEGKIGLETKLIKEGDFQGEIVSPKAARAIRTKQREAFERALLVLKQERTGFKTPLRLAGIKERVPRRLAEPGAPQKKEAIGTDDDAKKLQSGKKTATKKKPENEKEEEEEELPM